MKAFKMLVSIIWGIYGATMLVTAFIIMLITYKVTLFFSKSKRAERFLLWFNARVISNVLFVILLIRLKVKGREHLEKRPYVIISNHLSTLDIVVNYAANPQLIKFLSKIENSKAPILGPVVKTACIIVDRSSRKSHLRSMKEMIACLKKDKTPIVIYPEGTRNRTNDYLQPFQDGAFHLAIKTGTPIAVQTIVGSNILYPANILIHLLPGTIHTYWDKPIETKGMTIDDIPKLKAQVREMMLANLQAHSREWEVFGVEV